MKRIGISILFALLFCLSGSVVNAASGPTPTPGPSTTPKIDTSPQGPFTRTGKTGRLGPNYNSCDTFDLLIGANSGWVNSGNDSLYDYAQVWYEVDHYNHSIECHFEQGKMGLWFRSSYTTCRSYTDLYLDEGQYPYHNMATNSWGTICGGNGSSYQSYGSIGYDEHACDPVEATTIMAIGTGSYAAWYC